MRMECSKVLIILLNIIIFICGACCLVAGILLRFDSGFMGSDVLGLLNRIEYYFLPMGVALELLAYLSIAFGSLLMILAVVGIVGAWQNSKGCLYCYLVSLVLMLVIEVVVIGIWIAVRGRNNQWLRGQLLAQLTPYTGPTGTDELSVGWNALFMEAHCCGVTEVVYTGSSSDFTDLPTTWVGGADLVPASCCQGVDEDKVASYVGSATCTTVPKNYYTKGCYETIKDHLEVYSILTMTACGVLILAQVITFVASCMLVATFPGSNGQNRPNNKVYPNRNMTPMTPTRGMTPMPMTPDFDDGRPPAYVAIDNFLKNKTTRRNVNNDL